jgi:hypothetical protein
MKKFASVVFSLILMVSAQNLIQNPGFETWSGSMPEHWEKDDSIFIYQEDIIVHTGNFSARDSLITQTQTSADLYQGRFAVQENTQYIFAFWVYDNDSAGRVRHGINWYPSGSNWSSDYSVNSTTWQEMSFTATSPSGTDSAFAIIRAYDVAANWDGDAIFCIDDVSFTIPATQPPVINRVWHMPINPGSGISVDVYAKVVDDGVIVADTLFYGINDLNNPTKTTHISASNDTFMFHIPGQAIADTVFYYLEFIDNDGLTTVSDTHAYYVGEAGIYINEILYETSGSDSACFVELYGPGNSSLDDYMLVGVNGFNGNVYASIDLMDNSIPNNGFFVIAQDSGVVNYDLVTGNANMQNGPDNVELRLNNIVIDALGYGALNGWFFTGEWLPASDVQQSHSLGRYPDGYDTDNNCDDFYDYTELTPGEPNLPASAHENEGARLNLPTMTNPIRAGVFFASLIKEFDAYPIIVYNPLGQIIMKVIKPRTTINLPCGVYFLKPENIRYGCLKTVIVK